MKQSLISELVLGNHTRNCSVDIVVSKVVEDNLTHQAQSFGVNVFYTSSFLADFVI